MIYMTKKREALLELKQKEYMKLVIDIPVKDFPIFFQACQEIGLTGEGVYYFFLTLNILIISFSYTGDIRENIHIYI